MSGFSTSSLLTLLQNFLSQPPDWKQVYALAAAQTSPFGNCDGQHRLQEIRDNIALAMLVYVTGRLTASGFPPALISRDSLIISAAELYANGSLGFLAGGAASFFPDAESSDLPRIFSCSLERMIAEGMASSRSYSRSGSEAEVQLTDLGLIAYVRIPRLSLF